MQTLSPKKYIETRVRNLPVYKCFVNKSWRESKMADVIVMRKHSNGNITVGLFLVDLLCLGVKDASFIFNEAEEDTNERLGPALKLCEEVDYNTAHNIVYAGHDFAAGFDIKPHKDFAVTKYILEADDDKIPLIEIPTGADDGKPHLIVSAPGQYADALAKLKKNAGEGNYYYSTELDNENSEGLTDPQTEAEFSEMLDDYEEEEVTPLAVQYIRNEDLEDQEKVENRSHLEQATIRTETFYRILKAIDPEYLYEGDVKERPECNYLIEAFRTTDIQDEEKAAFINAKHEIAEYFEGGKPLADNKDFLKKVLHKYDESAYVVSNVYDLFIHQKDEELIPLAASYLEKLAPVKPLAILSLALGALIMRKNEPRFEFIYSEPDFAKAFPAKKEFDAFELGTFWLIQVYVYAEKGDLKNAFHYYELFAETRMQSWLLPFVQFALSVKTEQVLEEKIKQRKIDMDEKNG